MPGHSQRSGHDHSTSDRLNKPWIGYNRAGTDFADIAAKYGAVTAAIESANKAQEEAGQRAQFFGDLGVTHSAT